MVALFYTVLLFCTLTDARAQEYPDSMLWLLLISSSFFYINHPHPGPLLIPLFLLLYITGGTGLGDLLLLTSASLLFPPGFLLLSLSLASLLAYLPSKRAKKVEIDVSEAVDEVLAEGGFWFGIRKVIWKRDVERLRERGVKRVKVWRGLVPFAPFLLLSFLLVTPLYPGPLHNYPVPLHLP